MRLSDAFWRGFIRGVCIVYALAGVFLLGYVIGVAEA